MSESIQDLQARIEGYAKAYYEGTSPISDAEYDQLIEELRLLTGEEPLAGGYVPAARKVKHLSRMGSLDKVRSREELQRWLAKLDPRTVVTVEPKWDGSSIEVQYDTAGQLQYAVTRGDGIVGEDVTETFRNIPSAPLQGREGEPRYGEVMMTRANLSRVNEVFGTSYANTRNSVPGILRRLDEQGREMAKYLQYLDHSTTRDLKSGPLAAGDIDNIMEQISGIERRRVDSRYDMDGAVIKVGDARLRESMGWGSTSPRWAVAFKFDAEVHQTTLRDVTWQLGRSGKLTPVAEFDPVELVGSWTTRATMHNYDIFTDHAPRVGDTVSVQRSGDVIPYIVGVERSDQSGEAIAPPTLCPRCESDLVHEGVNLVCNANCNMSAMLINSVRVMDLKGISHNIINGLLETERLDHLDVVNALETLCFKLEMDDLTDLPRMGLVSSEKALNILRDVRDLYQHVWLAALGIKGMGTTQARAISDHIGSLEDISSATYDEILSTPGFGPGRAEILVEAQEKIGRLAEMLRNNGVQAPRAADDQDDAQVNEDSPWSGLTVVVTGVLPEGITRNDVHSWLTSQGATIGSGVNGKTDVLVAGEKAGSKLAKAESLGVRIVPGTAVAEEMQA